MEKTDSNAMSTEQVVAKTSDNVRHCTTYLRLIILTMDRLNKEVGKIKNNLE